MPLRMLMDTTVTKPRLPPAPRRSVLKEIHLEPRVSQRGRGVGTSKI